MDCSASRSPPAAFATPGPLASSSGFGTPGTSAFATPGTSAEVFATPLSAMATKPPAQTQVGFKKGDRVEAHGLAGAKYLNGRRGTILSVTKDRFGIQFDGDADQKALKPANLHRVEESEPSESHVSLEASSLATEDDFPVHRALRTPARCLQDVRDSLPAHDPADHRAPPSDSEEEERQRLSAEDESGLPSWCRRWSHVNQSVAEQSLWGPGGGQELLTQAKLPKASRGEAPEGYPVFDYEEVFATPKA